MSLEFEVLDVIPATPEEIYEAWLDSEEHYVVLALPSFFKVEFRFTNHDYSQVTVYGNQVACFNQLGIVKPRAEEGLSDLVGYPLVNLLEAPYIEKADDINKY